jgi:hypothetical protein
MLIFARQWYVDLMLVSPTPGGVVLQNFFFGIFGEFIVVGSLIPILVVLWRLVTYYPYLIIGAF